MRRKTSILVGCMVSLVSGFLMTPMEAQTDRAIVVFKIGKFDRSSAEFSKTETQPINFIAGKSDPAKDWYAIQPAVLASPTGQRPTDKASAARAITFTLNRAPGAAYRLHVSLLVESASVPVLHVSINGKQGEFYLHPKLDYSDGDYNSPIYSHADVVFDLPGRYLQRGVNVITFQSVEDAKEVIPDASLTYDAIELDQDPADFHFQAPSAQIVPTVFYQKRQGGLDEIVDLFVRYYEQPKSNSWVDMTIAGRHYHEMIHGGHDFGEKKLEFSVPEFPAHTQAQLTWNVAGHRQHNEQFIDPQKKWTLLLVPHIHLDIGYTDYQAKVAAVQSRVIDEAMDLTAQHPDFRFSLDGAWSLEQFMKTRTPADRQRAIAAVKSQQLFVPAEYANLLTGFPTAETLVRSLYASANFSREHNTPFNYANITDVPSYSWSYASILASAGIHSLIAGGNDGRALTLQGRPNENSPFWWEGPDGQKVLVWYSDMYLQMQIMFGLPPIVSAGHDTLPLFLQQYEHPSYHANAAIIYGTQVENTDLFPQQAELAQQWNRIYAYPHMQYSGFYDALKNIAQQFGNDIPTVRGDGAPYWEDGVASDAYYAAMERGNEGRGPSAEKLATLTSLVNPRLAADKKDLDRMWQDMVLMDEHTWTSWDSVSEPTKSEAVGQLAVKNMYAVKAHERADFLARNSMASLTDSIPVGQGSLVVFNTLNWKRNGLVLFDLQKNDEIVDALSEQVVPVEVLREGNGFRHVRFTAQDVPAVGYKVFQLRHTNAATVPVETEHTTVLESPYYRVELDPASGAVRSIYDKQLQRELVDQKNPYRFGQYLYVTSGDHVPYTALEHSLVHPRPDVQIHPARDGHLVSITRTPYGWIARMESTDTNTPKIASEIRLFNEEKKIEFVEDVNKKEVDTKEAVYFAFPFAMSGPQFQYEIQNGVVDPAKDMYPGAGHEWFSVQHWVSVQKNGFSASVLPLDASLITLGDVLRDARPAKWGERPGIIFSYVMNNYWDTNYRAGQGGHFRFRYVITSAHLTSPVELSRLGWEEMTPLEVNEVTSQDKALNSPRPLDGEQGSFLTVNDPELLLDTWKPAEDGKGTILRFLDLGGAPRTVTVKAPLLQLDQAMQTDSVERNQRPLSLTGADGFEFIIHPHEIVTVRVVGKDVAGKK